MWVIVNHLGKYLATMVVAREGVDLMLKTFVSQEALGVTYQPCCFREKEGAEAYIRDHDYFRGCTAELWSEASVESEEDD